MYLFDFLHFIFIIFHMQIRRILYFYHHEPKKSTLKLNQLPDLCLIAIFTRLPLNDLLKIEKVCERWKVLLPSVTIKISSLTIQIEKLYNRVDPIHTPFIYPYAELLLKNNDDQNDNFDLKYDKQLYNKFNTLEFGIAEYNQSLIEQIINTFPKVTSLELTLNFTSNKYLEPIVHLLVHWHSQLISIKLSLLNQKGFSDPIDCCPLFSSLNQLFSPLKILALKLDMPASVDNVSLPIIGQLEQFYYFGYRMGKEKFLPFVMGNPKLRRFGLPYQTNMDFIPFEMSNRVTHLVHDLDYESRQVFQHVDTSNLEKFCTKFASLTGVSVKLNKHDFRTILTTLSKLTQLTYLRLVIDFGAPRDPEQTGQNDKQPPPKKAIYKLPQLIQVKTIQFDLRDMTVASNFTSLNIPYHFPSVQVIELSFRSIEQSHLYRPLPNGRGYIVDYNIYGPTLDYHLESEPKRELYHHLKACPRLHHLFDDSQLIWFREGACSSICTKKYDHSNAEMIV